MLDLAGIPFYAKDRDDRWPLIVAGGPCACNAELLRISLMSSSWVRARTSCPPSAPRSKKGQKKGASPKRELLLNIAKIPGVYIPAFYDVTYYEDGG